MGSALSRFAVSEGHRCQKYAGHESHCPYRIEPEDQEAGELYCPLHLAENNVRTKKVTYGKRLDMYRLKTWQSRLDELKGMDEFKSVRDEIGILRITLESVVNSCNTEAEVLINSARISDLADKIHRVVVACHKLEKSTGLLLDKAAAIAMGGRIVEIIASHVNDPAIVEKIAGEIIQVIQDAEPTNADDEE